MELDMDIGDVSITRDFLHSTILDSGLTLDQKISRMSHALTRGDIDIGCTLDDDPSLGGVFPLLLAINMGGSELVEFLLTRGADVNQSLEEPHFDQAVCPTALHQACLDGRLDLVQILVEHDGCPDGPHFPPLESCPFCVNLESTNSRGQTPFHLAVESGNSDLVTYLVEGGSRVNKCDANGNNALHMTTCLAPDCFALDMVDTLVGFGVSVYHRNRLGFTPVRLAMLLGREASARMMLSSRSHGLSLHEVGFHPLEAAVVNRRRRAIASLLGRPSRIPSTDESLNMVVLNSGQNGILKQLLGCPQMRAVVDSVGSLGFTPLYNACAGRNTDAVRLLLESGADPDRPSQRQHVLPLKKTVLQNDLALSRLLLDHGASACHCSRCSPLLRQRLVPGSQAALIGVGDGELDLLYLGLFTDSSICRVLIVGGTCVSSKACQVMTSTEFRDIYVDLYRAGHHRVLREVLAVKRSTTDDLGDDYDLREALRSPSSLKLLCRVVLRGVFSPRVFWVVPKIDLPKSIRDYLLLET